MLDKQRLLADADCIVVAQSLGLTLQRRGRYKSILCPEHADRHFGNCIIDHNSYHCFACQAHGDAIDLVKYTQDCSYEEAFAYVADLCGGEEQYIINNTQHEDKQRPFLPFDAKKYLNLIDHPVYRITGEADSFKESTELQSEGYRVEHIEEYAKNARANQPPIFSAYVVSAIACHSPLGELYSKNEAEYYHLLYQRCEEKAEELNAFYDVLMDEPSVCIAAANMYLKDTKKLSGIFQKYCIGKEPKNFFKLKKKARSVLDSAAWMGQSGESTVGF